MSMYRKLLISALALLALASCTKETAVGDVQACFCACVSPDMAVFTKATGEPEPVVADKAVLQAWRGDVMAAEDVKAVTPGETTVNFSGVKLAAGVEYDIYIMVYNDGYYETSDLRSVSLSTDKAYDGKTPEFDAFYSCTTVTCGQNDEVHQVTLTRPFAKVSFSAAVEQNVTISYKAPTTLNLKTGEVSGARNVEYTMQPAESSVIAFDYIFATEDVSQLAYTFRLGEEEKTTSIPVKRNAKTNIQYNKLIINNLLGGG